MRDNGEVGPNVIRNLAAESLGPVQKHLLGFL
jgi:hypothetical protein